MSEGISAMANFDGIVNYEGAGWMFFDCRLAGYGARFSLDREDGDGGRVEHSYCMNAALIECWITVVLPWGNRGHDLNNRLQSPGKTKQR